MSSNNSNIKVGSPLMFKMNTDLESPIKLVDNNAFVSPKLKNHKPSDRFIPNRVSANLYNLFMAESGGTNNCDTENLKQKPVNPSQNSENPRDE